MNEPTQTIPEKKRKLTRLGVLKAAAITFVFTVALLIFCGTDKPLFKDVPDWVVGNVFVIAGVSLLVCVLVGILMLIRWLTCWRNWRRLLIGAAVVATLIAIFYAEENWRGKRVWEQCKRELAASGHTLDWDTYIPAPLPDDQNIFKAPHMQEWFVGRGSNELSFRIGQCGQLQTPVVALVDVKPLDDPSESADLVLQYRNHLLGTVLSATNTAAEPVIPLIVLDSVPLRNAIANLAQQANIKYSLDSLFGSMGTQSAPYSQAEVSLRWENVTARQALLALLHNYQLELVEDPKSRLMTITHQQFAKVGLDRAAEERLMTILEPAIQSSSNPPSGPTLKSCRYPSFSFATGMIDQPKPARVIVRSESVPSDRELAGFFQKVPGGVTATTVGSNSFRINLAHSPFYSAREHLASTGQLEPELSAIRQGLKRPYARIDGDYLHPMDMPIQNFVSLRLLAQTLADRAKCHLLSGQPEQALGDLALLHDLRRLLEPPPPGKQTTLVAAMIKVAIAGLYAETIADGFRLNAWREPRLVALQAQLAEVDLLPQVEQAFITEPAAECRAFEICTVTDLNKWYWSREKSWFQRVTSPEYLLLTVFPRGWRYQNMAVLARLQQQHQEGTDLARRVVFPRTVQEANQRLQKQLVPGPFHILSTIGIPNVSRAKQTAARNQTMADQALIACALERYRLAHGQYPETLDSLIPQFLVKLPHDIIGGQPLKYRRTEGGKFVLYSVGWNEKDDGGQFTTSAKTWENLDHGDWGWLGPE